MSRTKTADEQAVVKAVRDGMSRGDAAALHGISVVTVNSYCQRNGIKAHAWLRPEEKTEIARMYAKGVLISDIASAMDKSTPAIIGVLQRMGVTKPRRKQSQEKVDVLNKLMSEGLVISTAARQAGMSPNTAIFYRDHQVAVSPTTISEECA